MEHIVSNELKQHILVDLIEPNYKNEIARNLRLKKNFKNMGLFFETLSKFFVGTSSVLSFSSGIYRFELLSFLAGTSSVVSLVMLQYSSYAYRESKKITKETNDILSKLHIQNISESKMSIDDNNSDKSTMEPSTPINK